MTPTPLRRDLDELLGALASPQAPATRRAITRAVLDLFDSATARPAPSDTNGSEPAEVERALFVEPVHAELLAMPRTIPNGIEVNA